MIKAFALGLTLAAASLLSAQAAPASGSATLKAEAATSKAIVDGALWKCAGTTCVASNVRSMAPARACKRVVSQVGEVTAFTYNNKALAEAELADCNTAAKK